MNRNRPVTKAPKKKFTTSRLSDRRQAGGQHADQYLLENQNRVHAVLRHDPKTGKTWHDKTLTDWDPSHFRLFVGNLGTEVTEDFLIQSFAKYESLSKVKVPMDDGKKENKGFAFLSFADANDYLNCYKEMNNKYVGSKPVTLERAKTEIGEVVKVAKSNQSNQNNKKRPFNKKRY